jgi:signal transduction histidine kinase
VFAALGTVAALLLSMVAADLLVAQRVALRTSAMVNDDLKSIELVDDMHEQADRMASPDLKDDELVAAARQIASDSRAYELLTPQPGEREEWEQLRAKLADLETRARARDFAGMPQRIEAIHQGVHQIVLINREAARQKGETIRGIHGNAIVADAVVGLLTLTTVAIIVVFVLRVLARQRALTLEHIALLSERNRELDAFAGRAAHDLRVPLNPIRGYADLLMTGKEPPGSVQEMAGRIRVAVDRMARVVDDMLDLSRAGRPPAGVASPAKVAAEVLEELRPQLADADVSMSLTDQAVACAPSVLAQLLRNLLTNAVKFRSHDRKLALVLRSESSPQSVDLVIEDNGLGMSDEDFAHAFEPHYRGSEHREVPGHGLGLAIVQRTVEAIGGKCRLARSASGGTAVTLSLPRAVAHAPAQ